MNELRSMLKIWDTFFGNIKNSVPYFKNKCPIFPKKVSHISKISVPYYQNMNLQVFSIFLSFDANLIIFLMQRRIVYEVPRIMSNF